MRCLVRRPKLGCEYLQPSLNQKARSSLLPLERELRDNVLAPVRFGESISLSSASIPRFAADKAASPMISAENC